MLITKTLFKEFLDLEMYAWYHVHDKEKYDWIQADTYGEIEMPDEDDFVDEGEEVERYFLQKYCIEDVVNISLLPIQEQESATKTAIAQRVPVIYQGTLSTPDAMTRFDILEHDIDSDSYRLIEIKSKTRIRNESNGKLTSVKADIRQDISFSAYILACHEIAICDHIVAFLDKTYYLDGEIDILKLFTSESLTHELMGSEEVEREIGRFKRALAMSLDEIQQTYPFTGSKYKSYYAIKPPKGTIEILGKLAGKRYTEVRQAGIFDLMEIQSDNLPLFTENQADYIVRYQAGKSIEYEELQSSLQALEFPLYFYDYETYTSGIPRFQGTHPWQQIFCQYSIHIMGTDGNIQHFEGIMQNGEKDNHRLIDAMMRDLGALSQGTFISWNEGFENSRNQELIEMYPEHSSNLQYMIDHTFDLMLVFKKGLYFEPACQGSSSLKAVLPALTDITYAGMPVGNGMEAMKVIERILLGKATEQEIKDCLTYCKQDTWAMVAIYKKLLEDLNV